MDYIRGIVKEDDTSEGGPDGAKWGKEKDEIGSRLSERMWSSWAHSAISWLEAKSGRGKEGKTEKKRVNECGHVESAFPERSRDYEGERQRERRNGALLQPREPRETERPGMESTTPTALYRTVRIQYAKTGSRLGLASGTIREGEEASGAAASFDSNGVLR
jgi:hypothetical protein